MIKQIKQKIVGMLTEGERPKPPYRLGVALSGGGARGFAHVGALKALEEAGMKPDVIAGVSAGAVAAVMYAAGVPPRRDALTVYFDKIHGFRPSVAHSWRWHVQSHAVQTVY